MKERAGGRLRCAIYTRKSTEEGLEQVFNTLDAQREACEAFIRSQAGEGWQALPRTYDDGGYSGGNMERPALRELLDDVDAGRVDVIVVYKVDRLTRSLMDFARIVERLDARSVSFVSVTQAFNTTTSMGRLTLNVLLSFAQFEREVTGERIRDKIAASKAKGMWMGGNVPLGYELRERRLHPNQAEAEVVRSIFSSYVELGSVPALVRDLNDRGCRSTRWVAGSGREQGSAWGCGALYYLLQNRIYLGEIVHRGKRYRGEHQGIVAADLFEAAQQKLAGNRATRRSSATRAAKCVLAGLVYTAAGEPMKPTFSYGSTGKLYRYYASAAAVALAGRPPQAVRTPAAPLERLVLDCVTRLDGAEVLLPWHEIIQHVLRVELGSAAIHVVLKPGALTEPFEEPEKAADRLSPRVAEHRLVGQADGSIRIICSHVRGSRRRREGQGELASNAEGPGNLAQALRSAHILLERSSASPLAPERHSHAEAPGFQRERRRMSLGLLAPAVQRAILEGRELQSASFLARDVPLAWADQLQLLDLS